MEQTMPPGSPPTQPQMTQQSNKHSGIGTASLILGILGLIFTCLFFVPFLIYVGLILGIIALILGAVAYWGQWKDKFGLAGFILGLISIIIFVVILIIGLFLIASFMSSAPSYSGY